MKKRPSRTKEQTFNVYLRGKWIDRIFYYSITQPLTEKEVKTNLIEHDGYDPAIQVEEKKP